MEAYLEQTIGSLVNQTLRNIEILCIDDASTDGEPEVIMKFVSRNFNMEDNSVVRNEETDDYIMTFAQHKTNKNCFFAVYSLKYNHYSIKKSKMEYLSEFLDHVKYHALCEGDDYWIAPEKLQKQVDIMEKDDSIGLVYTKAKKVINRNRQVSGIIGKKFSSIDELVVDNKIPTLTTCYRKTVYDICQKELGCNLSGLSLGDYQLWLMFKIKSEVAFYEKVCAIYRVLEESASHSKSIDKMLKFYCF